MSETLPLDRLPLGKHSGWLIREVASFCPEYLLWLLSQEKMAPYPSHYERIKQILQDYDNYVGKDVFILNEFFLQKAQRIGHPVDTLMRDGAGDYCVHTRCRMYYVVRPCAKNLLAVEDFLERYPTGDESVYAEHARAVSRRYQKDRPPTAAEVRRIRMRLKSTLMPPTAEQREKYEAILTKVSLATASS